MHGTREQRKIKRSTESSLTLQKQQITQNDSRGVPKFGRPEWHRSISSCFLIKMITAQQIRPLQNYPGCRHRQKSLKLGQALAMNNFGDSNISTHPETFIVAGFARLPASAVSVCGTGTLAIEFEVDPYTMRFVDASCNCLSPLGQKLLEQALIGASVTDGIENGIAQIRRRYFGATQRAFIAALEDVGKQLERLLKDRLNGANCDSAHDAC